MKNYVILITAFAAMPAFAAPCAGIDRSLEEQQKATLAPALEVHLNRQLAPIAGQPIQLQPNDVLQIFHLGNWQIVRVNTHVTDDPYLFYQIAPSESVGYVTAWAGGAAASETAEIERWVEANAPGIPARLAQCFAWYVTKGIAQ